MKTKIEAPRPVIDDFSDAPRYFARNLADDAEEMKARNQSLDVLRGVAVLGVICCHYPLVPLMERGGAGVDLFFVLSGFLISGLLFADIKKSGSVSVGRFYIRRGFKIYPSFYVFIFALALLIPALRKYMLVESLFLQSYVPIHGNHFSHLWSLAVEEHFYIALPLLLVALLKFKRLHWIPWISLGLAVVCGIMRIGTVNPQTTHLHIDELFAGVSLGYCFAFRPEIFERISRVRFLPLAVLLLIPANLTCNCLAFSALLVWSVPRKFRALSPLAWVGRYSYSIYLWHLPFVLIFLPMGNRTALKFAELTLASIAFGFLMAKLVECPALRMREKLFPAASEPIRVIVRGIKGSEGIAMTTVRGCGNTRRIDVACAE